MKLYRIVFSGFLLGLYSGAAVMANPQGAHVMHGQVSFAYPDSHTLNITNSPNSVINWQQFSIQQNEVTRFIQESPSSAVLNRVNGQNPSDILGQLLSNGRVFIINPNGIVFGKDAVVDTAGLVASTLDMTNEDFIAGNLRFEGEKAAAIENRGYIKAGEKGEVFLIAPNIENSGIIETNGGEIFLAAGESVTIASLDYDHIIFEVQAPGNKVVNLGQIITRGGAAKMFAGAIKHSGSVNANSISVDKNGNIQLVAKADIEIAKNAMISANGAQGGEIRIESDMGTVWNSGAIEAKGESDTGGHIRLLGERVALFDAAGIDVSGEAGGGEVLIGGDYKGANLDIRNAQKTYVGEETLIKANAVTSGDGGKVIIWADETTQAYGKISAKGGSDAGNGGFIETSGKRYLEIGEHSPDASASNGKAGTWLLDPENVDITNLQSNISQSGSGDPGPINFAPLADDTTTTVAVGLINVALNNGSNVVVTTNSGGSDPGNITVSSAIAKTADGGLGNGSTLTLDANNNIDINAGITSTAGVLNLILDSGGIINIAADIDTNGGLIDAQSMGTGNVTFSGTRIIDSDFDATTLTLVGTNDISFNGTTNTATLNHNAGTLAGTGTVNVSSTWNQSSATTINGNLSIGVGIPKTFNGITIFGNGTITSASSLTIASSTNTFDPTLNLAGLSVTGGTLQGSGDITVSTSMILDNGGTIGGSGTITTQAGSATTLANGNNGILADSRIWENFGTVNFLAPSSFSRFHLNGTSQFINRSTGVFNFDVDEDNGSVILGAATGRFTNEGTFNNTGVEIGRIQTIVFDNDGTVAVQNNRLEIEVGGTDTGDYTVASGTVLAFDSGTRNFNSGVDFSGLGTVQFDGATANLNSGTTFTASGLSATNGTVTFDTVGGAATINLSSLSVTGGTLQGPDNFVVSTGMSLTNGGTIGGSGTITTQAGSATTLANGNNGILADSRIWENFGTVNFLAPSSFSRFHLQDTSQFINRSTGVFNFDVDDDNGTVILNTGTFTNEGTFNNTGVEIGRIQSTFNNTGTVNVQNNRLEIEAGGTDTGDYTVASGTVLAFDAGTRNLNGPGSISGLGTVILAGADLNVNNTSSISNFTHSSGILGGSGSLTVNNTWTPTSGITVNGTLITPNVPITIDSFTINGNGSLTLPGLLTHNSGTFTVDPTLNVGALVMEGGTITGDGDINVTNGVTFNDSATITTTAAGVLNITDGLSLDLNRDTVTLNRNVIINGNSSWEVANPTFSPPQSTVTGTGSITNNGIVTMPVTGSAPIHIDSAFINNGTVTKNGGTGNLLFNGNLVNDGVINANFDVIEFNGGGTHTGSFIAGGGTLDFGGGTHNFNSGASVTGTSTISFTSGSTNFNTGSSYNSGAGSTTLISNGTHTFDVDLNTGGDLTITRGTLTGAGDFTVSGSTDWSTNDATIGGSGTLFANGGFNLNPGDNDTLTINRTVEIGVGSNSTWESALNTGLTGDQGIDISSTGSIINKGTIVNEDMRIEFTIGSGLSFTNDTTGILTKQQGSTGTGNLVFDGAFNNNGIVNVNFDTIDFLAGGTHTGNFNVASGATLDFSSGTHNVNATGNISGLGTLQLSGATLNINNSLSISSFTHSSGTLGGSSTLTVNNIWTPTSGVTVDANLILTNAVANTLNAFTLNGSGTVDHQGTVNHSSGTLSLYPATSIDTLNLSGGDITIGNTLTLNNQLNWSDVATITGGILNLNGTNTLSGDGIGNLNRIFDNVTVNNTGTFNQAPSGDDDLVLNNGTVFNNQIGGVFDLQADSDVLNSAGAANFNNFGIVQKTAAGGTSSYSMLLTNDGTIDVQSGTLAINNGLTWDGGNITGSGGANLTLAGALTISGSATKTLNSFTLSPASLVIGGTGILDINGGTVNVAGLTTINSGATLQLSTSTFSTNTLTLDNGNITGSGDLTVPGLIIWDDGSMSGAGTTFANGGIDFTGFANRVIDRNVEHSGTRTWTASGSIGGSGLFTHQSGTLTFSTRFFMNDFENNATVVVNVPGDLVGFDDVQNNGTMQINNGTFRVDGSGNNTTGVFTVAAGANLLFRNDYDFSGGSISGAGTVEIDGSDFDVMGGSSITPQSLLLTDGEFHVDGGTGAIAGTTVVSASAALRITSGSFSSTAGLTNDGLITLDAGSLSLTTSATHTGVFDGSAGASYVFSGGTHNFNSGADISGDNDILISGAILNLNNGATYDLAGTTQVTSGTLNINTSAQTNQFDFSGGLIDITNSTDTFSVLGTSNWTGGTQQGSGNFNTQGSVTINGPVTLDGIWNNNGTANWNGTSDLAGTGNLNNAGIFNINADRDTSTVFSNSGTINKISSGTTSFSDPFSITNSGTVDIQAGILTVTNTAYIQTTGSTNLSGGILDVTSNGFSLNGGSLAGIGDVLGDVVNSAGTVIPGASPGQLSISGDYTQLSGASLQIELGGLNQGIDYDFLSVGNTASLDGSLNISFFGGFTPNPADQFDIISASNIVGDFQTVSQPVADQLQASANVPVTGTYQLEYVAMSPPPPTPSPVDPEPTVTPNPEEDTLSLPSDEVLILSEYQQSITTSLAQVSTEQNSDEEDEKRELVCR